MSLIDDVKKICDRLAPLGWGALLKAVTNNALNISQPSAAALQTELGKVLPQIDRSKKGFEDFHPTAKRAITGGRPASSLLYHALASPQVHPGPDGKISANPADYPSLIELDTLENYIYSLVADRTDLADTVLAVFAYQYREASRTTHLSHADIAYSRTGVARVGTTEQHYDGSRRSFWVIPKNGMAGVAVLPARYGVFLARRAKPGAAGSVMGGFGPNDKNFVFPVHKLFAGSECLKGQTLKLAFQEFHRNEKLRRTHRVPVASGGLPVPAGFDINKTPYVRDSRNNGNLVSIQLAGASALIVPTPGQTLTRTVTQFNVLTNKEQMVYFQVPPDNGNSRLTTSSMMIPATNGDRLAPEYVNIRHQVKPTGPANQVPADMNQLDTASFLAAMAAGQYPAAHFTDDSCDGCIEAVVQGLVAAPENLPAFSLVTAPDFFPLADQSELEAAGGILNVAPLSSGRLPANPSLPLPSHLASFAFPRTDTTITAVVGAAPMGQPVPVFGQPNRAVGFLPDSASDVFAPGWDTSRSRDALGPFLTSYGLGSPFPEDAKLCAAIGSFWPAVAPDNARTFGNEKGTGISLKNQLPMLDEELGFHPDHQRVKANEVTSYPGWDGEFGPFFETVNGKLCVNYVAIERSDYVSHALAGRIHAALTAEVQSEDLIARNRAFTACNRVIQAGSGTFVNLVVLRKVDDWRQANGDARLSGGGFLLEFAELKGARLPTNDVVRVRRLVKKRHLFQFGVNGFAYKNGTAAFEFHEA